ncbi:MAG: hypothetical protein GY797_18065, partial [Deltaproteobacteria bacterium]|nr:hypothetical protein [Deltaproteobacteria bacterium]
KIYIGMIHAALRDYLLDAIESVTDLTDIQHQLAATSNVRKTLFFSLVYGILGGFSASVFTSIYKGGFVGFGPTILIMMIYIIMGMVTYIFLMALAFIARIGRYRFKLYAADPSNSEIIDHSSGLLMTGVYMAAVLAAMGTFAFVAFELVTIESIAFMVLLGWGPLTAFFVINQITLRKIITRAKWEKLNEVQMQIETLETQEDIPSEKTLGHLSKLIEYHNQILGTPNSALNLRAGLNFLNSLLIPLLAFILANLDKVLAFFQAG